MSKRTHADIQTQTTKTRVVVTALGVLGVSAFAFFQGETIALAPIVAIVLYMVMSGIKTGYPEGVKPAPAREFKDEPQWYKRYVKWRRNNTTSPKQIVVAIAGIIAVQAAVSFLFL